MVANRGRSGFSSGVVVSITTTISTFLCTSIPAILYDIASSWRGSGRTRAKKGYTPSRATTLPARMGWRDINWFKTHVPDQTQKRPHHIQSANGLCCPRLTDRNARLDLTNFHFDGWAADPCETQNRGLMVDYSGCRSCNTRGVFPAASSCHHVADFVVGVHFRNNFRAEAASGGGQRKIRAGTRLAGRRPSLLDLEALTQIANGSITFEANRIVLTLSSFSPSIVMWLFSRDFMQAGIEAIALLREWASPLANTIQNGYDRTLGSGLS
jgi:hypothetical protein